MSTAAISSEKPLRVLLIEDYEEDAVLLERFLARAGYKVHARRIDTEAQLREILTQPELIDLVLADYTLPSFSARDALAIIQESRLEVPFIIVSGTIDEVSAVSAMRAGAHDYVLKGHLERLLPSIERELADAERRRERLRTEAELRLVQQRFSATFNQAAVGMAHTSITGRFQLVNQRLAEMLGVAVDRLATLSLTDFLMPSEREQEAAELAALVAGKKAGYCVENELLRSDGTTFPAQLTVSLLREDDSRAPSLLWVVEDISARKAAERETGELMTRLINSERLAAAGRMANTLAHEINNPLEALTNIVYLLQTHDLPPQARELAAVAARELERVGHITRSTLSFYRKVPGRMLDLRTILDEVVQLFSSRAMQHRIHIESSFDDSVREAVYDPALRQVFANLVGNAIESMEGSGGRLIVRARLERSQSVVLISDTGHGIEPVHLRSVFEPFFTTKGERGTGLGLWVTRGIVEEQGGRLHLRTRTSGRCRGTTVRVELPVVRQAGVASNTMVLVN
ncbi:MAG TPA: ATP-binding protein [Acidobacteriaceae bacterium]|jgi:PAS domain S-box-containing protein